MPPATSTGAMGNGGATSGVPPSLVGDPRNTWAFAPLDDPERIVVEGTSRRQRSWSTSKVLVAAAFVATVGRGDPTRLDAHQRSLVQRALSASDASALLGMARAIPGGPGPVMTRILRSIGDTSTPDAPSHNTGTMTWSVEAQVRFLAAMAHDRVVSPGTSRFLLESMKPIPEHAWGLGRLGASALKGGWLASDRESRQMGILDGYAVAILTDAVGPAVRQSDGEYAHVEALNGLADRLKLRLHADAEAHRQ